MVGSGQRGVGLLTQVAILGSAVRGRAQGGGSVDIAIQADAPPTGGVNQPSFLSVAISNPAGTTVAIRLEAQTTSPGLMPGSLPAGCDSSFSGDELDVGCDLMLPSGTYTIQLPWTASQAGMVEWDVTAFPLSPVMDDDTSNNVAATATAIMEGSIVEPFGVLADFGMSGATPPSLTVTSSATHTAVAPYRIRVESAGQFQSLEVLMRLSSPEGAAYEKVTPSPNCMRFDDALFECRFRTFPGLGTSSVTLVADIAISQPSTALHSVEIYADGGPPRFVFTEVASQDSPAPSTPFSATLRVPTSSPVGFPGTLVIGLQPPVQGVTARGVLLADPPESATFGKNVTTTPPGDLIAPTPDSLHVFFGSPATDTASEVEVGFDVRAQRSPIPLFTFFDVEVDGAFVALSAPTMVTGGPPTPDIIGMPRDPTNKTGARFTFTGSAGARFHCQLDGGPFSPCTSPKMCPGLGEGPHVFSVKASKRGVESPAATYTWTVDVVPPPPPAITQMPADPTNERTATFGFEDSEAGVTFVCRRDGQPFKPCTSPITYTGLLHGRHTFDVKALDPARNGSAAASFAWMVDRKPPPKPKIGTKPANPTNQTDATFAFTHGEPGVTFQCHLAGGPFSACSSPTTYPGLDEGVHAFAVKAVDGAGNEGPAAVYSWTVDTPPPPDPMITRMPADPTNRRSATFRFSSVEAGVRFFCGLDGEPFEACESPTTFKGLGAGPHVFEVKARDRAGNESNGAAFSWTIDLTPPATPAFTETPADPTSDTTATFAFEAGEAGVTFTCRSSGPVTRRAPAGMSPLVTPPRAP